MNIDISHGNGTDTFTVSQNSPLSDLLDHFEDTTDDLYDLLNLLVTYQAAIQEAIFRTVADARGDGITWDVVGQALGVTKQAAQQRYGS